MVVVVPALAVREQGDDPVVAAVVGRLVVAVAPDMGDRVDRPGAVKHDDRAHEHSPDEQAGGELAGAGQRAGGKPADREANRGDQGRVGHVDPKPRAAALERDVEGIAEQVADIPLIAEHVAVVAVLHQQPAHVPPEEPGQRGVGIGLLIRLLVVHAVDRDPAGGRILERADAKDGQRVLEPLRAGEALMREEAVVSDRDAEHAEEKVAGDGGGHSGPTKKPGQEGEQRRRVDHRQGQQIVPLDRHGLGGLWDVERLMPAEDGVVEGIDRGGGDRLGGTGFDRDRHAGTAALRMRGKAFDDGPRLLLPGRTVEGGDFRRRGKRAEEETG
jgi:hypothetical protein